HSEQNVLLVGPPALGKTMLAKRIAIIFASFFFEEALECTEIHSVSDLLPANAALVTTGPFRSPRQSVSEASLIGGGSIPPPGERETGQPAVGPEPRSGTVAGVEGETHGPSRARLHVDRVTGGDSNYCYPGCHPLPGVCAGAREGAADHLREQHEAARVRSD